MCEYDHLRVYNTEKDARQAFAGDLQTHYNRIQEAFTLYGEKFAEALDVDLNALGELVKVHDISKRTDQVEFDGYMHNAYPYIDDNLSSYGLRKSIFDQSRLHHYENNPHHPEYWIYVDADLKSLEARPMEKIYVAEMVLDWIANEQGRKTTRINVIDYWRNRIGAKYMHRDTIKYVDTLIDIVEDVRHEKGLLNAEVHRNIDLMHDVEINHDLDIFVNHINPDNIIHDKDDD